MVPLVGRKDSVSAILLLFVVASLLFIATSSPVAATRLKPERVLQAAARGEGEQFEGEGTIVQMHCLPLPPFELADGLIETLAEGEKGVSWSERRGAKERDGDPRRR